MLKILSVINFFSQLFPKNSILIYRTLHGYNCCDLIKTVIIEWFIKTVFGRLMFLDIIPVDC